MSSKQEATLLSMWRIALSMPTNGLYYAFKDIDAIGVLGRDTLRINMKKMRELGLVHFARGLMNEDGEVSGSGYKITEAGILWLQNINKERCETCRRPRRIHVCWSCGGKDRADPQPGSGCINCRQSGWDQTPCLPAKKETA